MSVRIRLLEIVSSTPPLLIINKTNMPLDIKYLRDRSPLDKEWLNDKEPALIATRINTSQTYLEVVAIGWRHPLSSGNVYWDNEEVFPDPDIQIFRPLEF